MAGEGLDAKALRDGKSAESADPDYAKAYVNWSLTSTLHLIFINLVRYARQATAHQLLGESEEARDIIAVALCRPALEDDKGLVECFIGLNTEKDFPTMRARSKTGCWT